MKNAEEHYNKLAEIYDIKWVRYNDRTAEEIIKNIKLKDKLRIFDAGCGTGILIKKILERNNKISVTGVDISKEMLKIAKSKLNSYKDVKLLNGDIENLKLKNKFDLIISNSVLHYLNDLDNIFVKFKSLLNKNGELILVDWSRDSILFKLLNYYFRLRIKAFKQIYTTEFIKETLNRNGFKIEKAYNFKIGFWNLYLVKAKIIK